MKTSQSPFAIMVDASAALAAAARLRSHLPPYQVRLDDGKDDEPEHMGSDQEVEKAK